MINQIGAYICQYIWKHNREYAKCFYTLDLTPNVEIVSCGHTSESDENMYMHSDVTVDGKTYCGNTIMHSSPEQYDKWCRSVHSKEANVSIHVIALENLDTTPIVCSPKVGTAFFAIIPEPLFARYFTISNSSGTLCGEYFSKQSDLIKTIITDNIFVKRLEHKCKHIEKELFRTQYNWVDTLMFAIFDSYQIATRNRKMYGSLLKEIKSYLIIQSIGTIQAMEALLLGTAGLLKRVEFSDDYTYLLRNEFDNLRKAHKLKTLNENYWDLGNGSGISTHVAIAQLAAILFYNKTLFYDIIESHSLANIRKLFEVEISDYWKTHYEFGVLDKKTSKYHKLSTAKINGLLINGILPFINLYAKINNMVNLDSQTIIDYYMDIENETNKFTRQWEQSGVEMTNAYESQTFVELSKNFCSDRRCYQCPIGVRMLKTTSYK